MLSIDGVDINEWKIDQLRQSVGYVTQDSFLFSDSILDNICFGLSNIMDSSKKDQLVSVADVLSIASIDKEIELFPEGYHTKLGERGVCLSGGQRQRLTIARALAKRPSILVLDDALSSVDGHTEDQILKGLKARPERNTEVIAAHRISTVKDADRILVLRDGAVVQEGTHAQLIAQCSGEYWHFYEQQRLKEDLESYA
jgi:ATP-binding cassette subfamily B protein